MKQLTHNLILIALVGIAFLMIAIKEIEGKKSYRQNESGYEQPFKKQSPSEAVKSDSDSQSIDKTDTLLPIIDGTMAGKKINYWIY